jgi:AraC-like DNA-binding protein
MPTTVLAQALGMRQAEFNLAFRGTYGVTPTAHQHRQRLAEACDLLRVSTPVEEVAARLGYRNPGSFINAFRKVFGESPAEWGARERHDKGQSRIASL